MGAPARSATGSATTPRPPPSATSAPRSVRWVGHDGVVTEPDGVILVPTAEGQDIGVHFKVDTGACNSMIARANVQQLIDANAVCREQRLEQPILLQSAFAGQPPVAVHTRLCFDAVIVNNRGIRRTLSLALLVVDGLLEDYALLSSTDWQRLGTDFVPALLPPATTAPAAPVKTTTTPPAGPGPVTTAAAPTAPATATTTTPVNVTVSTNTVHMFKPEDAPTLEEIAEAQRTCINAGSFTPDDTFSQRGTVWYDSNGLVYVPDHAALRVPILVLAHAGAAGHSGRRRTEAAIRRYFTWPRLRENVASFVSACLHCHRAGPASTASAPSHSSVTALQSQPTPKRKAGL